MMVTETDGQKPALCLFATKHIDSGSEILYNYGVRLPWQSKKVSIYRECRKISMGIYTVITL